MCVSGETSDVVCSERVRRAAHSDFPSAPSVAACGCGGEIACSLLPLLESLDVMAELQRRSELQPHVLHHHVAPQ